MVSFGIHNLSTIYPSDLFFSFQEFDDNRDAEDAAYELNGKELCGERCVHIAMLSLSNSL